MFWGVSSSTVALVEQLIQATDNADGIMALKSSSCSKLDNSATTICLSEPRIRWQLSPAFTRLGHWATANPFERNEPYNVVPQLFRDRSNSGRIEWNLRIARVIRFIVSVLHSSTSAKADDNDILILIYALIRKVIHVHMHCWRL